MNFRALALGAIFGFVVAIVPSCGAAKCGPANCNGCCDAKGACVKRENSGLNTTCGTAGNACTDCSATGQTCNNFVCTTGSTGGGMGGGTGGGGGTTCDGCRLPSGTCVPLSATTVNNCGSGGNMCAACSTGQLCVNGGCQTVDAGGGVNVGSPCTTDTQCAAVPVSASEQQQGIRPFCKKTSASLGLDPYDYKDGYCTKRCLGNSACGSDNKCGFFFGFIGELENICLDGCTAQTDCRDGYGCVNFGSTQQPYAVCYPLLTDGGLPDFADAGPSRTAEAGSACTGNTDCQPPDNGECLPATLPDGGAGFPGGMCYADCSIEASDSFCGEFGACDPSVTSDSRGPFVYWGCFRQCSTDGGTKLADGGAFPACRTGYDCVEGNFNDICVPQ